MNSQVLKSMLIAKATRNINVNVYLHELCVEPFQMTDSYY